MLRPGGPPGEGVADAEERIGTVAAGVGVITGGGLVKGVAAGVGKHTGEGLVEGEGAPAREGGEVGAGGERVAICWLINQFELGKLLKLFRKHELETCYI